MTNGMTFELRGDREIVLSRQFDAPPSLVWQAYTDCAHLKHWWGPKGWDLTHCKLDLRPGGKWHYCMAGEYEGQIEESWGLATFEEIDAPDRLQYRESFSDADGNMLDGMPEMSVEVLFRKVDGGTCLTSITTFDSTEARQQTLDMGVEAGIIETWDRLVAYLRQLQPTS